MGEIFRVVAAVSPVNVLKNAGDKTPALAGLALKAYPLAELEAMRVGTLRRVIREHAATCAGCAEKREFVARVLELQAEVEEAKAALKNRKGKGKGKEKGKGSGRKASRKAAKKAKALAASERRTRASLQGERVGTLRRLLSALGGGKQCAGCVEKGDFVEQILKVQKQLLGAVAPVAEAGAEVEAEAEAVCGAAGGAAGDGDGCVGEGSLEDDYGGRAGAGAGATATAREEYVDGGDEVVADDGDDDDEDGSGGGGGLVGGTAYDLPSRGAATSPLHILPG
jgi:hypothetical protein